MLTLKINASYVYCFPSRKLFPCTNEVLIKKTTTKRLLGTEQYLKWSLSLGDYFWINQHCCSVTSQLCDPVDYSTPAPMSLTISWSLPKFISITLVITLHGNIGFGGSMNVQGSVEWHDVHALLMKNQARLVTDFTSKQSEKCTDSQLLWDVRLQCISLECRYLTWQWEIAVKVLI